MLKWKRHVVAPVVLLPTGSNAVIVPTVMSVSTANRAHRDSGTNRRTEVLSLAAFLATVMDMQTFATPRVDDASVNTTQPVTIVNDAPVATTATHLKEPTAIAILAPVRMEAPVSSWATKRSSVSSAQSVTPDHVVNCAATAITAIPRVVSVLAAPVSRATVTATSTPMQWVTAIEHRASASNVSTTLAAIVAIPARPVSSVTLLHC